MQLGVERIVGERLAPAALELVERGDQRLGDIPAAVRAEDVRAHLRSLDEGANAVVILDPRLALERRRRVDRPRPDRHDRRMDVLGAEPARQDDATAGCGRGAPVRRIAVLPRLVEHARDLAAVAEERRLTASHRPAVVGVELDQVCGRLLGVLDEDRDRQRRLRHVEHLARAARAALDEDEAEQVGSRLDRGVDVVLPRQPAHLHERSREQLAELRLRVRRLHERRADENRVRTRKLGGGALRARVHAALGDHEAIARCARDELELGAAVDREGRRDRAR